MAVCVGVWVNVLVEVGVEVGVIVGVVVCVGVRVTQIPEPESQTALKTGTPVSQPPDSAGPHAGSSP